MVQLAHLTQTLIAINHSFGVGDIVEVKTNQQENKPATEGFVLRKRVSMKEEQKPFIVFKNPHRFRKYKVRFLGRIRNIQP